MTELMQVIVIISAMALVILAMAAWALMMVMIRIVTRLEELVMIMEKDSPQCCEPIRGRPPDESAEPKARADRYEAPMVRRARARMEEKMRRDGYEL